MPSSRRHCRNATIFSSIDKGTGLRAIVAVSLVVDVLASLWMSTAPPVKVAPDFYSGSAAERVARLSPAMPGLQPLNKKKLKSRAIT